MTTKKFLKPDRKTPAGFSTHSLIMSTWNTNATHSPNTDNVSKVQTHNSIVSGFHGYTIRYYGALSFVHDHDPEIILRVNYHIFFYIYSNNTWGNIE